jgi:uncharacterized membrane protein YeaQ/YmgE (transglycosylase-associated protein family)
MAWYQRHKVIAGALAGFAAGTVVPGLGNAVGAIVGAFVGPAIIDDEKHTHPGWFKLKGDDEVR